MDVEGANHCNKYSLESVTPSHLNFAKRFGEIGSGCLWAKKINRFFRFFVYSVKLLKSVPYLVLAEHISLIHSYQDNICLFVVPYIPRLCCNMQHIDHNSGSDQPGLLEGTPLAVLHCSLKRKDAFISQKIYHFYL